MELEEIVTSLDLSKQLKALGCKQESFFYWVEKEDGDFELIYIKEISNNTNLNIIDYSAYTEPELVNLIEQSEINEDDIKTPVDNLASAFIDKLKKT